MPAQDPPFRRTDLSSLPRIANAGIVWRPIRRELGLTAFGVNGYTGDAPGDDLIEPHDETSGGAGGHEELYLVLCGRARFEIAGDLVDAPAGTLIAVPVGVSRRAVAEEVATTVVVVGAAPGGALPASPFEHWFLAEPAYQRGDYAEAYEIAARGLADWPDHGHLNYQLACYKALDGDREGAICHLSRAYRGNPDTREWAAADDDLASVRDDPALRP